MPFVSVSCSLFIAGFIEMNSSTRHLLSSSKIPFKKTMSRFHSRSKSFPSSSCRLIDEIEDRLCWLKDSDSTSTSAKSLCSNLANLVNLNEDVRIMIQTPSVQKALSGTKNRIWIDEILDSSIRLVDLCGVSRDVVCLAKESVQDLESSVRRNRSDTATSDAVSSYMESRKKVYNMVRKCTKNLKIFNQNSMAQLDRDDDLTAITAVLKQMVAVSSSVLKSVLTLVSGTAARSNQKWPFFSGFSKNILVHEEAKEENNCWDLYALNIREMDKSNMHKVCKKLRSLETTTYDLEEGLESFFSSLVKTRVSLLNALSH